MTANLRAPIVTKVDDKPTVRVHSTEWRKVMAGEPVEINPSVSLLMLEGRAVAVVFCVRYASASAVARWRGRFHNGLLQAKHRDCPGEAARALCPTTCRIPLLLPLPETTGGPRLPRDDGGGVERAVEEE